MKSFSQRVTEASRGDGRSPLTRLPTPAPARRHTTMRRNLFTLVAVTLLAVGASGVVAATLDAPSADTQSADALPANHTVDVINPGDVSDDAVDRAVETTWADDEVRSYFADGAAVHFEVWGGLHDGTINVDVAPADAPDDTRVVATVDPETGTVTTVEEPVRLNASNAVSIDLGENGTVSADGDEYEVNDSEASTDRNRTYTADQSVRIDLDEDSLERGADGTFSVEVENAMSDAEVFRIDTGNATADE
jgi:hypothetical protein